MLVSVSGGAALATSSSSGVCWSRLPFWRRPERQTADVVPVDPAVRKTVRIIRADRAVDQNRERPAQHVKPFRPVTHTDRSCVLGTHIDVEVRKLVAIAVGEDPESAVIVDPSRAHRGRVRERASRGAGRWGFKGVAECLARPSVLNTELGGPIRAAAVYRRSVVAVLVYRKHRRQVALQPGSWRSPLEPESPKHGPEMTRLLSRATETASYSGLRARGRTSAPEGTRVASLASPATRRFAGFRTR